MQVFERKNAQRYIGVLKFKPEKIQYREGAPAQIIGEKNTFAACMHCANPQCLFLHKLDISCGDVPDFPSEQSNEACPVGAISWDPSKDIPVINQNQCINCGVCAARCPIGAIYFDNGFKVSERNDDLLFVCGASDEIVNQQKRQKRDLCSVARSGRLLRETDELLSECYSKIERIRSNDHNAIVRSVLVALGNQCAIRRIGDVYTRMDAVYSSLEGAFGAVEIEFGHDTLDASRGILDDIAVLNTRYGIKKENNTPLVVCLNMPNARQGYWQVVKDVMRVEGIRINTVSIGALMILLWRGRLFDLKNLEFYVDYDNMSIRGFMEELIGEPVRISDKHLGILEPSK